MPKYTKEYQHINKKIGAKINELRIYMGFSLEQLAERIGVTHQQAQKYEKGVNNIPLGGLIEIAEALEKPVSYFLEGLEEENASIPSRRRIMCIEVARNFMRIKNPIQQDAVNFLTKVLAEE